MTSKAAGNGRLPGWAKWPVVLMTVMLVLPIPAAEALSDIEIVTEVVESMDQVVQSLMDLSFEISSNSTNGSDSQPTKNFPETLQGKFFLPKGSFAPLKKKKSHLPPLIFLFGDHKEPSSPPLVEQEKVHSIQPEDDQKATNPESSELEDPYMAPYDISDPFVVASYKNSRLQRQHKQQQRHERELQQHHQQIQGPQNQQQHQDVDPKTAREATIDLGCPEAEQQCRKLNWDLNEGLQITEEINEGVINDDQVSRADDVEASVKEIVDEDAEWLMELDVDKLVEATQVLTTSVGETEQILDDMKDDQEAEDKKELMIIIGSCVGAVVVLIIIIGVGYYIWSEKKKKSTTKSPDQQNNQITKSPDQNNQGNKKSFFGKFGKTPGKPKVPKKTKDTSAQSNGRVEELALSPQSTALPHREDQMSQPPFQDNENRLANNNLQNPCDPTQPQHGFLPKHLSAVGREDNHLQTIGTENDNFTFAKKENETAHDQFHPTREDHDTDDANFQKRGKSQYQDGDQPQYRSNSRLGYRKDEQTTGYRNYNPRNPYMDSDESHPDPRTKSSEHRNGRRRDHETEERRPNNRNYEADDRQSNNRDNVRRPRSEYRDRERNDYRRGDQRANREINRFRPRTENPDKRRHRDHNSPSTARRPYQSLDRQRPESGDPHHRRPRQPHPPGKDMSIPRPKIQIPNQQRNRPVSSPPYSPDDNADHREEDPYRRSRPQQRPDHAVIRNDHRQPSRRPRSRSPNSKPTSWGYQNPDLERNTTPTYRKDWAYGGFD